MSTLILSTAILKPVTSFLYSGVIDTRNAVESSQRESERPQEQMKYKQLGRRNLTDEQRTVLIGKMYEARKNTHGGDRKSSTQNGNLNEPQRVSDQIAQELGVAKNTVMRTELFFIRQYWQEVMITVNGSRNTYYANQNVRQNRRSVQKEKRNRL